MASAKSNRKLDAKTSDSGKVPTCPVCLEDMTIPVYLCQSGHSLCSSCTSKLQPAICPLCRSLMTKMRNRIVEELISEVKVPCPNKSEGCIYILAATDIDEHLKECIFRQMDCPVGAVFGRCSWKGKLTNLADHTRERHPEQCNVGTDNAIEIRGINIRADDRYLYVVSQGKIIFVITFKIDVQQKMVYWAIQHIGSKKIAKEHIYEIHVTSMIDPRRKVVFSEHCFSDALRADEVFRQAKCAMLPLEALEHFVRDGKLSFRFLIKRIPSPSNNKEGGENKRKPPKKWSKGPLQTTG